MFIKRCSICVPSLNRIWGGTCNRHPHPRKKIPPKLLAQIEAMLVYHRSKNKQVKTWYASLPYKIKTAYSYLRKNKSKIKHDTMLECLEETYSGPSQLS